MMQGINGLLLWLSARGTGTWQRFRACVEELQLTVNAAAQEHAAETLTSYMELPEYQRIRQNLERLAHVEFFTGGGDWRVTPPTLAQADNSFSVLCGARSGGLLKALKENPSVDVAIVSQEDAPDAITIKGRPQDLQALATTLNVRCQPNASISILRSLPAIDDPRCWTPATLPKGPGWEVERFIVPELVWKPSSLAHAVDDRAALYRFHLAHEWRYFFCTRGEAFSTDVQTGKYISAAAGARHVLRYDETQQCLQLPGIMRPPLLVERALILCAGVLPTYDPGSKILEYQSIDNEVFRLTQSVLSQET